MAGTVVVQVMTVEEARGCVNEIKRGMFDIRYLVWDLHEREGWRALGYHNWQECKECEFEESARHIERLLMAAQIEQNILPEHTTPGSYVPIPEKHLRPLTGLQPEIQKRVYEQATATAPEGKVTAKHVEKTVTEWTYNQGIQYGAAASTHKPPVIEADEDEQTITIRAFELGYFMALGKKYTPAQVAEEFELSPSGAYRLLTRASGSKRVSLYPDEGVWVVGDPDAKNWPY